MTRRTPGYTPPSLSETITAIATHNSELIEINSRVLALHQQYAKTKLEMEKLVRTANISITVPRFGSLYESPEESHWEESTRCW